MLPPEFVARTGRRTHFSTAFCGKPVLDVDRPFLYSHETGAASRHAAKAGIKEYGANVPDDAPDEYDEEGLRRLKSLRGRICLREGAGAVSTSVTPTSWKNEGFPQS